MGKGKKNSDSIQERLNLNNIIGKYCKIFDSELKNSTLGDNITIGDQATLNKSILESNIWINRRNFIFNSHIGRFSYTGIGTLIFSSTIGRFCSISWNVSIGGNNHPNDNVTTSTLSRFYSLLSTAENEYVSNSLKLTLENMKPCQIGNDVLISSNAIILRDLKIGDGAIVGAGAVVTKDVEPYTVVAGVPARPIRRRFSDKIIADLLEIKWWNWPVDLINQNLDLIYKTKVDSDVIKKLKEIANKNNLWLCLHLS